MRIFVHKERCEKDEKIGHKILMSSYVFFFVEREASNKCHEIFFMHWSGQVS